MQEAITIDQYGSLKAENKQYQTEVEEMKQKTIQCNKNYAELVIQMNINKEEYKLKMDDRFPDWSYVQSCLNASIKTIWKECIGKDYNDSIVMLLETLNSSQKVKNL
jgi:hypothetical protein